MPGRSIAALAAAGLALCCAPRADAALLSRLGGQALYDTGRDVTWLADVNAGAGSIFDDGVSNTDGLMTWANANAWAANLAVGGVGGWRLPATLIPDSSCFIDYQGNSPSTGSNGFFCTGSEMGHMYYDVLDGISGGPLNVADPDFALLVNPMFNLRQYWSSTDIPPSGNSVDTAWSFDFRVGRQEPAGEPNELFAWAVLDGDVAAAAVPEPSSVGLFGAGLLGFAVARRRWTSRSRIEVRHCPPPRHRP